MHRAVKKRVEKAHSRKNETVQRVQIVEPGTRIWKLWVKPVFLWRLVEVCGFAIAIWALLETVQNNKLTRDALNETIQNNEMTRNALAETKRQTALTQNGITLAKEQTEIARNEAEQGRIIAAWNILTTKAPGNSGKKEALETLNSAGKDLSGIDLSCKTMGGLSNQFSPCFPPTFLRATEIPKIRMEAANLSGVDLQHSNLLEARLDGTDLTGANLEKVIFRRAKLRHVDLTRAILFRANFTEASLEKSILVKAILSHANLANANLNSSNFRGADLFNADLSDVFLSDANFEDANLSNASLERANLKDLRSWVPKRPGRVFQRANFDKTNLTNANLRDANLTNVTMKKTVLISSNLTNTLLKGANLVDANLEDAILAGTNLINANLKGANLKGVNLSEAYVCNEFVEPVLCAKNLEQSQVNEAWAWADALPKLDSFDKRLNLTPPPLCPVRLRKEYEAANRRGKPVGC